MDLDFIKHVLDMMREHDLAEFEVEGDGLKLRLRKRGQDVVMAPMAHPVAAAPAAAPVPVSAAGPQAAPTVAAPAEEHEPVNLAVIKSPIVGTFYRSPEPGARSFIEVGDTVAKGQVLCIIEAMKLMNEIESDCDGEIAAIYVENGKPVQFGERLFAVKVG
jgi:acetyl-CoA carboxylase biotin carboxyl carrier protein